MQPRICLLLSGRAGAGKSTVAQALVASGADRAPAQSWSELAFAGPLKTCALHLLTALFPDASVTMETLTDPVLKETPLRNNATGTAVKWFDGELTPRRFLQYLGTDIGRNILGTDVWTRALLRAAEQVPGHLVIPDARFVNEVTMGEEFKAIGFTHVFRFNIQRPEGAHGTTATSHASETALDGFTGFDAVFNNDSTPEALVTNVTHALRLTMP